MQKLKKLLVFCHKNKKDISMSRKQWIHFIDGGKLIADCSFVVLNPFHSYICDCSSYLLITDNIIWFAFTKKLQRYK